jgi:hypothetical protein
MIKYLVASSILMFGSVGMIGQQQQTKTFVEKDGTKEVLDSTTGWTETEKNGKVTHVTVADMTSLCGKIDNSDRILLALLKQNPGGLAMTSEICDEWGEVLPKTQIERVPFSQLMIRLVSVAPPFSTFARYRGMELKSETDSKTYDAIILPNDIDYPATCTVGEENRHEKGMLYVYECLVKTTSFSAALQLKDRLVQALSSLHLTEDEVFEHGLSSNARGLGYCAPSGECMHEHNYESVAKDWKLVQIEPNPDFTRDTLSEISSRSRDTRANQRNRSRFRHSVVSGFSLGQNKIDDSDQGKTTAKN